MAIERELRGFSYKNTPLKEIDRAEGWRIYYKDETNELDLSMGGSSFILGYGNSVVMKGVEEDLLQYGRCQSNRGHWTEKTDYAGSILLNVGKWTSFSWAISGTSAVECAIEMNDAYWRNSDNKICTFPTTWHGTSYFIKCLGGTVRTSSRVLYCNGLNDIQRNMKNEKVGAVLIDSCSWFQGNKLKDEAWWKNLRKLCDQNDVLLIVDDVANGWGKCKDFYSYNTFMHGVKPDIVAIGKSLAAGYTPIAAAVCNIKVADEISKPGRFNFNHTHQPNMAGITMLINTYEYIIENDLMNKSVLIEKRLHNIANNMMDKGMITGFRSAGLFLTLVYPNDLELHHGLSSQVNKNRLRIVAPLIANDQYFNELTEILYAET